MGQMDILIRDVPEGIHAELSRRASAENKSLRAYLLEVLSRHVTTPTLVDWLEEVHSLAPARPAPTVAKRAGRTKRDAESVPPRRTGADLVREARAEADRSRA
jgi:hypothetical protein